MNEIIFRIGVDEIDGDYGHAIVTDVEKREAILTPAAFNESL